MPIVIAVVGAGLVVVVLGVLFVVCVPALDERLGILTGRDLRLFLAYEVAGSTVADLIALRLGVVSWQTTHRDLLSNTSIQTTAKDGRRYCWNLSHRPPRPWLSRRAHYVTPTNRHAAEVIPELLPKGVRPSRLVEQAYGPGVVYDMANPEETRRWLEPFLKKKFPDMFTREEKGENGGAVEQGDEADEAQGGTRTAS